MNFKEQYDKINKIDKAKYFCLVYDNYTELKLKKEDSNRLLINIKDIITFLYKENYVDKFDIYLLTEEIENEVKKYDLLGRSRKK